MPRLRSVLMFVCCSIAAGGAGAIAAVPSPTNSTVPACMAPCPLGDMPFPVVVRDPGNNPVIGSSVVIDFTQCPGAYLCPGIPTDPYLTDPVGRTLRATTGAGGSVTFPARVGGIGGLGSVRVFADGVLLASLALASPDQDGDGMVVSIIGLDDPAFAAKLGTTNPTADFDCDGDVDSVDEQIFFHHHSHSCYGYVDPARRGTWGTLKAHYR